MIIKKQKQSLKENFTLNEKVTEKEQATQISAVEKEQTIDDAIDKDLALDSEEKK